MPEVKMHSLQGRRRTTERLLTLMKQIRPQDVLTPKRLAVKLGVSERTVYRYLRLLQTNDLLVKHSSQRQRRYVLNPDKILFLFRESPEGGYEAYAPGYSIYTQGESLTELNQMVVDAVRCHFNDDAMPSEIQLVKEGLTTI
jgi:hypothetical protein